MNNLEAIDARVSCRRYEGLLPGEVLATCERLAAAQNREGQLTIRLVREGAHQFGGFLRTYGRFSGVQSFFIMAGHHTDPYLREKVGYHGEQLVLELTKMGLGTCWVAGTFDRAGIARKLESDQELCAVITVGTPAARKAPKPHKSKRLEQMYTADSPPPAWFLKGMQAVQKAPSALNRQPVHFAWENGVARARVPGKDAMEIIDLGIAKRHFELAAQGRFEPGNGGAFAFLVSGGEP